MHKVFLRLVIVVAALLLAACSGGGGLQSAPDTTAPRLDAPELLGVGMKSTSGAPAGIYVEWTRSTSPAAVGYYLYRYTDITRPPEPEPGDNPPFPISLRTNGGEMIPQPASGETVRFEDIFECLVNVTYYYRVTVVDNQEPPQESYPSNEMGWTVHGHTVTGLTPTEGYWGDTITVSGDTFGDTQDTGDEVRFPAYDGGEIAGTVLTWTDTEITATIPVGALTGKVIIKVNDTFAETDEELVIYNPYVTSIDPVLGFSEDTLTINGNGLGADQGDSTVFIGATDATAAVTSWSDTLVTLTVPVEVSRGDVVLTIDGLDTNPIEFTPRPEILGLSPASIQAGEPITIQGRHFLASGGRVLFNGIEELTIDSWADDAITVSGIVAVPGAHLVKVETSETHESNEYNLPVTADLTVDMGSLDPGTIYTVATAPAIEVITAADADRVELIIDGSVYAESTTAPFDDMVLPVAELINGLHQVHLKAYRRAIEAECADQPVYIYSLPADVNADGVVDDKDTALLQTLLWMTSLDDGFMPWYDPDEDGTVTEADNSAVGYFWGNSIGS